jgi:hypothetical protein
MMRLLPWLIILTGVTIGAQEVREASFLPVRFYVGDVVELRIRVGVPEGGSLKPPDSVVQGTWLTVDRVEATMSRSDEGEVRIFFRTFRPGAHSLPEIDLGQVRLTGLRAETRSVLEDREEAAWTSSRAQVILPGTATILALLVVCLLSVPPLLITLARRLIKAIGEYRSRRARRAPLSLIKSSLAVLSKQIGELDPPFFYRRIAEVLRNYLHGRLGFAARMSTSLELGRVLPGRLEAMGASGNLEGSSPEDRKVLAQEVFRVLRHADHVKFGGIDATSDQMRLTVEEVMRIAESVERETEDVES